MRPRAHTPRSGPERVWPSRRGATRTRADTQVCPYHPPASPITKHHAPIVILRHPSFFWLLTSDSRRSRQQDEAGEPVDRIAEPVEIAAMLGHGLLHGPRHRVAGGVDLRCPFSVEPL